METKYLIFDCSTENDSLVAVVTWTPELAKSVLTRIGLAFEMKQADDDFLGIQFIAWNAELYERSIIEEVVPESEDSRWGILTEKPHDASFFSSSVHTSRLNSKVRLSSCFLDVDDKAFCWGMYPKHWNSRIETPALMKDTEGLFR